MSTPIKQLFWSGSDPVQCEVCETPFNQRFYDARLQIGSCRGVWALLCPACYKKFGCELGTGKGQVYERLPSDRRRWLKVGG